MPQVTFNPGLTLTGFRTTKPTVRMNEIMFSFDSSVTLRNPLELCFRRK